MRKVRILYKKLGRAVYISHLDIMRTFQRALKRAEVDVKHTEGFNPHPYISIALPLSLGYSGECELLDLVLLSDEDNDELIRRLNLALPEGIEAVSAYEGGRPVRDIAYSEFCMSLKYDDGATCGISGRINALFSRNELIVIKRSKRGECETDIVPLIKTLKASEDCGEVKVCAVLAAGASALNPEYLLKAIEKYEPELSPSFCEISHTNIFDSQLKEFR